MKPQVANRGRTGDAERLPFVISQGLRGGIAIKEADRPCALSQRFDILRVKEQLTFSMAEKDHAADQLRDFLENGNIKNSVNFPEAVLPRNAGAARLAIAGANQKFVWAMARVDGEKVIVSSEAVPEPVAVRYGWAANPQCNLVNAAGLPASPFRTDDWK